MLGEFLVGELFHQFHFHRVPHLWVQRLSPERDSENVRPVEEPTHHVSRGDLLYRGRVGFDVTELGDAALQIADLLRDIGLYASNVHVRVDANVFVEQYFRVHVLLVA